MPPVSVGLFPDYLSSVVRLLTTTVLDSAVDIYVDGPDHGSLQDRRLQREVHSNIGAANERGAQVRILLSAPLARISRVNPDRDRVEDFRALKGTPGLEEFLAAQRPMLPRPETPDEVKLSVDAYMNVMLKDYFDWDLPVGFLSGEADDRPRFFLWRADGQVIYVPFPDERHFLAEGYLVTGRDVQPFVNLFNHHWGLATPMRRDRWIPPENRWAAPERKPR